MKRFLALLFSCLFLFSGCSQTVTQPETKETLQIVATLFPQYDFAKTIAETRAQVTLLLPPGAESHSYEPTSRDIIKINESDLFIYTGEAMEGWAASVLKGLEKEPEILNLSDGLSLDSEKNHGHDHHHDVDPHIFTNPVMALSMAEAIENTLCRLDPDGEATYRKNGSFLRSQLSLLDKNIREIVASGNRKRLVFGGRFAFSYFVEEYGLSHVAAYDSCSSETEPSAAALSEIIDLVREEKIPVVFYEELSDPKTTQLICEETDAVPLLLHSCHNLSKEDFEKGETYLSIMEKNLNHLKEGLK